MNNIKFSLKIPKRKNNTFLFFLMTFTNYKIMLNQYSEQDSIYENLYQATFCLVTWVNNEWQAKTVAWQHEMT